MKWNSIEEELDSAFAISPPISNAEMDQINDVVFEELSTVTAEA